MLKATKAVEIPLKPTLTPLRPLPAGINEVIECEYAAKYLELMGVNPTQENMNLILKNVPIGDAYIQNVRASIDSILILPGMSKKVKESHNIINKFLINVPEEDIEKTGKTKYSSPNKKDNKNHDNFKSSKTLQNLDFQSDFYLDNNLLIAGKGRRVSWCTVNTLNLLHPLIQKIGIDNLRSIEFGSLLYPPVIEEKLLLKPVFKFCASLVDYVPRVRRDKTGKLFEGIGRMLESNACVRLYGLLCHFLYWSIIHPTVSHVFNLLEDNYYRGPCEMEETEDSLDGNSRNGNINYTRSQAANQMSPAEIETLFIHLEECLQDVQKKFGPNEFALVTSLQALVACCHYTIDFALSKLYPWFTSLTDPKNEKKHETKFQMSDIGMNLHTNARSGQSQGSILEQCNHKSRISSLVHPSQFNLSLELRRLIHQVIADFLDPARLFTSTMIGSTSIGPHKPLRQSGNKYFTTSMSIRAIFGDAKDASTRKFLGMGNKPYVSIPGAIGQKYDTDEMNFLTSTFSGTDINYYNTATATKERHHQFNNTTGTGVGTDTAPSESAHYNGIIGTQEDVHAHVNIMDSTAADSVQSSILINKQNLMKSLRDVRETKSRNGQRPSHSMTRELSQRVMTALSVSEDPGSMRGMERDRDREPQLSRLRPRPNTTSALETSLPQIDFKNLFKSQEHRDNHTHDSPHKHTHSHSHINPNTNTLSRTQLSYPSVDMITKSKESIFSSDSNASGRSIVLNTNSKIPLTLKGKSCLISLAINKASAYYTSGTGAYSTRIQDISRRPELLQGI